MIKLINLDELRPGMFIHKMEVWWLKDKRIHNQMLVTDPRQIETLRNEGIQQLWIDLAKSIQPTAPVTSPPKESVQSVYFKELDHARLIFQQGKPRVMAMFNEARLGHSLNLAYTLDLVDEIAGSVGRHPSALISVARLKNHDDYTYLHSMAVCGLMVSLAQQTGLPPDQVRRAGLGGLMHDVGKAMIPLEILNKPGKLTPTEVTLMQQHPVVGAQMLMEANAGDDIVDIALHHHEKVDGSGYPHGLKGNEISRFSRMAAVCDVYDAITSVRSYKEGWNPAQAMHQMANWRGHFDSAMLHAFVKSIGIYPVGSLVRLASGRVALVVEAGKQSLLRPLVHVFWSLYSHRPITPEVLDLGDSFCTDSIIGAEEMDLWSQVDLNKIWLLQA